MPVQSVPVAHAEHLEAVSQPRIADSHVLVDLSLVAIAARLGLRTELQLLLLQGLQPLLLHVDCQRPVVSRGFPL